MLVDKDYTTCIIGIDPGSTNLGVGIIYFNTHTLEIIGNEAFTFNADKLNGNEWLIDNHGDRVQRIYRHRDNLITLFNRLNPLVVVSESPFINMRMPGAYGALTEVVYAIRQAVIEYNINTPFYLIEPSNVKKAIGAMGNAKKDIIKLCLLNNVVLRKTALLNLEQLDEHSVDALCVAYGQYRKYKGI